MATRTFLDQAQHSRADSILHANVAARPRFSQWLGDELQKKMEAIPEWQQAGPIALGSWSRGELCPKSDIDILFCGKESAVRTLMQKLQGQGFKVRSRLPENFQDWTEGVESFDVLALWQGVPLTVQATSLYEPQKQQIAAKIKKWRRQWLKAIREERKQRARRFDSIAAFLEPNLKYGQGGLRDIEQALAILSLYPERFVSSDTHAQDVLIETKEFFLFIRQKLHLLGGGDILSAPEQFRLTEWLGYSHNMEFMREVQKGLARASFYADWVVETASASKARLEKVHRRRLRKITDFCVALKEDASILMQKRVRQEASAVAKTELKGAAWKEAGRELEYFLSPTTSDAETVAFFRSRLIDSFVPDFKAVVGHVQHDQYHRYSVDAHLLQAVRELKRVARVPKEIGRLRKTVQELKAEHWKILAWACLYHDIAKGTGGDHAQKGQAWVRRDLARFGKSADFIESVAWLVEEHLVFSEAAFRRNPKAPETWRFLSEKNVREERIPLLATFTIVDIRATNPEAWTLWKERLLADLVEAYQSPQTNRVLQFWHKAAGLKASLSERVLLGLDPYVIEQIPNSVLLQDLMAIHKTQESLPPLLVQNRGRDMWVRFHSKEDKPGLLFRYVGTLFAAGCSVRHAVVWTDAELGVYDWFQVKTSKTAVVLRKTLSLSTAPARLPGSVHFDQIELVSRDEREWVISFRGRDQSGALIAAAQALYEEGASILWAKVHTWGRQIDDVFGVKPLGEKGAQVLDALQKRFILAGEFSSAQSASRGTSER